MSEISRNQTTEARFRFNMTAQDALDLLAAAYCFEVRRRHGQLVLDENTEGNLANLAKYITLENPKFGVMCCGTCGNGKTTLLYAFQRAVNYLDDRRHFSFLDNGNTRFEAGIRIMTAKEIVRTARDYKAFKELQTRPMLAIDDLGAEPAEILDYGNVLNPVTDLIEHRYNRQLFTFVTTNLTASSADEKAVTIRRKYGARIADRFNEMLHVIIFRDISYRAMRQS